MIDHEETGYSVATGARKLVGHRMNGGLEDTCAVIRVRHASSGHAASVGERWKASMTRVSIPAPYAATQMMQAAWHAPGRLWVRPVHAYRPGQSYNRREKDGQQSAVGFRDSDTASIRHRLNGDGHGSTVPDSGVYHA